MFENPHNRYYIQHVCIITPVLIINMCALSVQVWLNISAVSCAPTQLSEFVSVLSLSLNAICLYSESAIYLYTESAKMAESFSAACLQLSCYRQAVHKCRCPRHLNMSWAPSHEEWHDCIHLHHNSTHIQRVLSRCWSIWSPISDLIRLMVMSCFMLKGRGWCGEKTVIAYCITPF